ncbi:DUF3231 family protein [Priestia megaterium]|uniref:DUF3231 family protein n=1 Tax=Priestia megaterium TaxID=1404 RepID=UPI000BEDC4A3|nr:DUF3231 family protein [Priestia megaterium]MDW4509530.1 DUF3231 family protein [Priestia megaterium]PEC42149.1 transcriptional regulator [Priestia megaterium]
MDNLHHEAKITASELACLWTQYLNDSLSRCILRYFINHVKDQNINEVLQYALELAENHLEKIKQFLTQEDYPIPIGFTNEDVTVDAPPLFTDTCMIVYLQIMSIHGLTRYSGAVGLSVREDQRTYFIKCNTETMELYNRATNVLVQKGIMSRPPALNNKQKIDFVKEQNFLRGWFGKHRPINAIEISGAFLNMQKTLVKIVLELGFSQVAQSKDVRDYMERSRKLCEKHFNILTSMLEEDNLHAPRTFESEVTDSTVPPFSDKLMMYHVAALLSAAIGYYGEALSICQRRDLSADYTRMITEMALLAEDGANLLINKGWMEQPPAAADRQGLAKNK